MHTLENFGTHRTTPTNLLEGVCAWYPQSLTRLDDGILEVVCLQDRSICRPMAEVGHELIATHIAASTTCAHLRKNLRGASELPGD